MTTVGTALWIGSGVVAAFLARIVPLRRGSVWLELLVGVIAALAGGLGATALDFGGWSEPDWRAGAFAFLLGAAGVGLLRVFRRG